jgi:small subunit ribosomal protein S4
MRALGVQLPGLSTKSVERRPYPPGQHGHERKKVTEYGRRLMEKQKLCVNYGVTERQLVRLVVSARGAKGPTGSRLLELLEKRLDNVVFRSGFARTIPGARQLVNHGHVLVNGKKVDRVSYSVRKGDVLTLRPASQNLTLVAGALEASRAYETGWLSVDKGTKVSTVLELPQATSVPFPIDIQLVIEFYSQRI